MPAGIDLHLHSSVSDGTETPSQLVRAAAAAGLGTIALTDHDSTAGWQEAFEEAPRAGVTVVPGMELSTQLDYASVHMLAYLFDPAAGDLVAEMARIRTERLNRAEAMVQRISADYALTWEDVLAQTVPGATVGRPHIADALVARGHAMTRSEAFAGILHWRAGYYQPHYAPDPLSAIRLVKAAGGVPVLAHPATRGVADLISESRLVELIDAGLFGLELDHRENKDEPTARMVQLASKHGLVITGSSDYHGAGKPNRLGENTTSPDVLERIIERGTGAEPVYGG